MWESLTGGREMSFKHETEFSGHNDGHDKKHRGQDQSDIEEKVCGDVGDVQRYCSQGRSRMAMEGQREEVGALWLRSWCGRKGTLHSLVQ